MLWFQEGPLGKVKDNEWKARWCELVTTGGTTMLLYRQRAGRRELGRIPLDGCHAIRVDVEGRAAFAIVDGVGQQYTFASPTGEVDLTAWLQAIDANRRVGLGPSEEVVEEVED